MDELIGRMVIVHPALTTDPINQRGEIGIITGADLEHDTVSVGFKSNVSGYYSTNALLVLKSHRSLYQDLLTSVQRLDTRDFKTLMDINLIQANGSPAQLTDALQRIKSSQSLMDFATISLQESLDQNQQQSIGLSR